MLLENMGSTWEYTLSRVWSQGLKPYRDTIHPPMAWRASSHASPVRHPHSHRHRVPPSQRLESQAVQID